MDQPDITALENQAIQAALNNDWSKAIILNEQIIKLSPKDSPSLNRLGIAYIKTNQLTSARNTFKKILKRNSNNPIAIKNLQILKHRSKDQASCSPPSINQSNTNFIEEPGISKIIPLIKPGSPKTITNLSIGESLTLKPSSRRIKVFTENNNEYIGRLPDNLSLTLSKFIKLGYKYQTCLKSTNPQAPQIFIKEIKRSKRLKGSPSFPLNGSKQNIRLPKAKLSVPPLEIFDPLTVED
jgi:tetratricopeptide (TPR) repeat protein